MGSLTGSHNSMIIYVVSDYGRNNAQGSGTYNTSSLAYLSKEGVTYSTARFYAGINSTMYRALNTINENWHGSRYTTIITNLLMKVYLGEQFVEEKLCLMVKGRLV